MRRSRSSATSPVIVHPASRSPLPGLLLLGAALLLDFHEDVKNLVDAAAAVAGYRGRGGGIEAAGEADIAIGRANLVSGVEAEPAEAVDIGLRPGVLSLRSAFAAGDEIAVHVAGWDSP